MCDKYNYIYNYRPFSRGELVKTKCLSISGFTFIFYLLAHINQQKDTVNFRRTPQMSFTNKYSWPSNRGKTRVGPPLFLEKVTSVSSSSLALLVFTHTTFDPCLENCMLFLVKAMCSRVTAQGLFDDGLFRTGYKRNGRIWGGQTVVQMKKKIRLNA